MPQKKVSANSWNPTLLQLCPIYDNAQMVRYYPTSPFMWLHIQSHFAIGKLQESISKMAASQIDVIETKLLKPRAYRVVGDKDFLTMTWKDFLKLD